MLGDRRENRGFAEEISFSHGQLAHQRVEQDVGGRWPQQRVDKGRSRSETRGPRGLAERVFHRAQPGRRKMQTQPACDQQTEFLEPGR